MSEELTIKGTVTRLDLKGGFWGIVDAEGNQWRPVKMPLALQVEGLNVTVNAKKAEEQMPAQMWGTAVKLNSFRVHLF